MARRLQSSANPKPRRMASAGLTTGVALGAVLLSGQASAAGHGVATSVCPAPAHLTFGAPQYVDTHRAGGEPLVRTYPNGRLIYSAHAGTTHFFTPAAANVGTGAFVQNYQGQTYVWTSDDQGKTWTFRPRLVPGQGFSDPDITVDSVGDVFFSEINLANVAVSKSTDRATTFSVQNVAGAVLTDRQWMAADRKDELYLVANGYGGGTGTPPSSTLGHYIAKSVNGGKTFTVNQPDETAGTGFGDIRVDKRNGTLYEAHGSGATLSVNAFRKARSGDLTATDSHPVATGVSMLSHWPAFDLDPSGNLYITWDESGKGSRPAGVWYSRSTDGARSWATPVRVNNSNRTAIWPWIGVGDKGRVAIAWLEADHALPNQDAQTSGTYGWRVVGAVTTTGLGCGRAGVPSFSVATATPVPIHTGTICQGGTTCQAELIDRRLGDYFSVAVDGSGRMYIGYADTRVPGAVALPGFVRQAGGPALLTAKRAGHSVTATTGQPALAVGSQPGSWGSATTTLAATGTSVGLLPAAGLLLIAGLLARRFRRA